METFRQREVPVTAGVLRETIELTNDARRDISSTMICTGAWLLPGTYGL